MRICVYVFAVLEGMFTCDTGNFVNNPLFLCLCCCRGYVHMQDWSFWKRYFVFMFVLLYWVCNHVMMGILATSLCVFVCVVVECTHIILGILAIIMCVHVCVVVEGMYTCNTGNFVNEHLCLCLRCCRGYVHMQDW